MRTISRVSAQHPRTNVWHLSKFTPRYMDKPDTEGFVYPACGSPGFKVRIGALGDWDEPKLPGWWCKRCASSELLL